MAKKEKAAPKEVPAKLAGFVDSPFRVYLVMGKKEREASVLSSGLIRFKEEEFKSPCAAATAMAKDMDEKWVLNAWTALKYNKDGERVALDTIRGSKSPLKAAPAPKAKKVAKAKTAKKRVRKEAPAATHREAVAEQAASA